MSWPEYVSFVETRRVPDEVHGKHFGHHARFERRYPGRWWIYTYVAVPIERLICAYWNLGEGPDCENGLIGELSGRWKDLRGQPLTEIAAAIAPLFHQGHDFQRGCPLKKIAAFMNLQTAELFALPETMMVIPRAETALLIEGNHRVLALALKGESTVVAAQFDTIRLEESG